MGRYWKGTLNQSILFLQNLLICMVHLEILIKLIWCLMQFQLKVLWHGLLLLGPMDIMNCIKMQLTFLIKWDILQTTSLLKPFYLYVTAGFVDDACRIFNSMPRNKIEASKEHFAIMVRLLTCNGQLEKAQRFEQMGSFL